MKKKKKVSSSCLKTNTKKKIQILKHQAFLVITDVYKKLS